MDIRLEKVNIEQKDTLYRLLQYSLFEESLTDGNEMNSDATFNYKYFDSYFTESNRDAFFIKESHGEKLLGFVMINQYMQRFHNGHSIAEFMIIPKYRRTGVGKKVAFTCFDLYKGNWEVSPSFGSDQAFNFWKKVINEYTDKNNKYENNIFMFNNEDI